MPQPKELSGWKAIANHLGVSVRTAQDYGKNLGLPVKHQPGARGRVFADPQELDAWRAGPPAGEEVADGIESPAPAMPPRSGRRSRLVVYLCLAGILTLGGLSAIYRLRADRRLPAAFHLQVSTLIVVDTQGQELWRHTFPDPLAADWYEGESRSNRCAFGDLDGDGRMETLFAYIPTNKEQVGTTLFCFSAEGKEKWRFDPGRNSALRDSTTAYLPPYYISNVRVIPAGAGRDARVVVSSNHHLHAPNQVTVLDRWGRSVGEYWHPGHLLHLAHADLDGDGKQKLLLAGVNNGHHAATLIVFDPSDVSGTADQLTDDRFQLQGLPKGTEKYVLLFPRTCVSAVEAYNRASKIHVMNNRIYVGVTEGVSEARPGGVVYELDYHLNVLNASPSWELEQAHRDMELSGLVHHSFSSKDGKDLAGRVVTLKRPGPAGAVKSVRLQRDQPNTTGVVPQMTVRDEF